jgi:hypothetical protein
MKIRAVARAVLLLGMLSCSGWVLAQQRGPAAPPPTGRPGAQIDLTGYWVSIVNEDWRWRMLTPPKGDYASVPLNPMGKKAADTWEPSQDGSCKAYYGAGLMRMPTRLHISWESDDVLKIESDWGEQTRHLYFKAVDMPAAGKSTPQGRSLASWESPVPLTAGLGVAQYSQLQAGSDHGGSLKVVTGDLAAGWLRRNGVPYGEKTMLTEYYDRFPGPDGSEWFVVTTIVDDPEYLAQPFITSSHFRRETDGSKWAPHPCKS